MTRRLVVMGSGETTPTMVTTHKRVLDALGPDAAAVLLDTPYGFQENVDELSRRARDYFGRHVGRTVRIVAAPRPATLSEVRSEQLAGRVAEADWVFAGPGSPTYLVDQWSATRLPQVLSDKLDRHGALVFSSAAACTLGSHAVPVYEIYKAGHDAVWADGLDLMAGIGLRAVVVPHFDNAEGGTHDTRYCYLGERRLTAMEARLPTDTWVLGVDEHTAMVLDLDAGVVEVDGRGGVTVRADGRHHVLPAGSRTALEEVVAIAEGRGTPGPPPAGPPPAGPSGAAATSAGGGATSVDHAGAEPSPASPGGSGAATSPLLEAVEEAADGFETRLTAGRPIDASEVTVDLQAALEAWAADPLQSHEPDRARAELRRQVVALARVAEQGLHRHRDLVAPHVELLLRLRDQARTERRFDEADTIRDVLLGGGVEVRDTAEGVVWEYHDPLEVPPMGDDSP